MHYKGHTLYYFSYKDLLFKIYKPEKNKNKVINNNSKEKKALSVLSLVYRSKYLLKRFVYIIPLFNIYIGGIPSKWICSKTIW